MSAGLSERRGFVAREGGRHPFNIKRLSPAFDSFAYCLQFAGEARRSRHGRVPLATAAAVRAGVSATRLPGCLLLTAALRPFSADAFY